MTTIVKTAPMPGLAALSKPAANIAFACVHFLVAILVAVFMTEGDVTVDTLSFSGQARTATLSIKWMLVTFGVVTGVFHLLYAAERRAGPWRYIEYAITATIMLAIIQLLSLETNWDIVMLTAGLTASTMLFGYIEDARFKNPTLSNAPFWFGWIPYFFAWFIVIKQFIGAVSSSPSGTVPAFVYAIIWIELALFSCFALVQYMFVVRKAVPDEAQIPAYEGTDNLLSITAKLFLIAMVFFGVEGMSTASPSPLS